MRINIDNEKPIKYTTIYFEIYFSYRFLKAVNEFEKPTFIYRANSQVNWMLFMEIQIFIQTYST